MKKFTSCGLTPALSGFLVIPIALGGILIFLWGSVGYAITSCFAVVLANLIGNKTITFVTWIMVLTVGIIGGLVVGWDWGILIIPLLLIVMSYIFPRSLWI